MTVLLSNEIQLMAVLHGCRGLLQVREQHMGKEAGEAVTEGNADRL